MWMGGVGVGGALVGWCGCRRMHIRLLTAFTMPASNV